jgi:hypothetical protein
MPKAFPIEFRRDVVAVARKGEAPLSQIAVRAPPGCEQLASQSGSHRGKPYRQAEHIPGPHQRPGSRPSLDSAAGYARRPGDRLPGPPGRRPGARPSAAAEGHVMIRFTWLQFRVQVTVALAALAAFAVLLVVTGPHLASLYSASAITGCHSGTCANAANTFLSRLTTTSPTRPCTNWASGSSSPRPRSSASSGAPR